MQIVNFGLEKKELYYICGEYHPTKIVRCLIILICESGLSWALVSDYFDSFNLFFVFVYIWDAARQNEQNVQCGQPWQINHGHLTSLISLCCLLNGKLRPQGLFMQTVKLIRLGGCQGWPKSSLGAQVILLFLPWYGSNCFTLVWFLFYGPSTHFRSFRAWSVT